jgi:hypothetical protein
LGRRRLAFAEATFPPAIETSLKGQQMKAHFYTRLGIFVSLLATLLVAFAIAASTAGAQQQVSAGFGGGTVSAGGGFGTGETIAIAAPLGVLALLILYGALRVRRSRPQLAVTPQLQEVPQPETQPEQQRKAA